MARITKCLKLIFHVTTIALISYYIKNQKVIKPVRKIERFLPDMKHLLIWTQVPGLKEGQKYFTEKNCDHLNCYLTTNRSFFEDIRYFDGIIFNAPDVSKHAHDLPKVRSVVQKYIFASNESSDNFPVCSPVYDDFFNWTWTYKPDSSIPYKFISVYNIHDEELGSHLKWQLNLRPASSQFTSSLSSKSLAAAIFLNKCNTNSKREKFLNNLKAHLAVYNLTVDVFGPCGTMRCGRTSMKPCFYRIRRNYFFYLALEDSIADDYITDLVLYAYKNDAVPVVYGGADYDKYLPPSSFINGLKLGEEETARQMYEAIQNRQIYFDFFKWKNHYIIKSSTVLDGCSLCYFMNSDSWLQNRVSYVQFRKWWNPYYTERCGSDKRFFVL